MKLFVPITVVSGLIPASRLGDMDLHFAWQAWHLATWILTLRGRRGTWWHGPSLCVAGVALAALGWLSHHLSHRTLSHTVFVTHHLSHTTLTHNFVTHHLSHTTLSHTIFHTPSFTHHLSHHFVTHHLSHTTLSDTIFHKPSFTHRFVTHHLSHTTLSHTIFHTPSLTHYLSHTIFHIQLCHTQLFTYNLFYFSILHHLLPCPPRYNICCPFFSKKLTCGVIRSFNFRRKSRRSHQLNALA